MQVRTETTWTNPNPNYKLIQNVTSNSSKLNVQNSNKYKNKQWNFLFLSNFFKISSSPSHLHILPFLSSSIFIFITLFQFCESPAHTNRILQISCIRYEWQHNNSRPIHKQALYKSRISIEISVFFLWIESFITGTTTSPANQTTTPYHHRTHASNLQEFSRSDS